MQLHRCQSLSVISKEEEEGDDDADDDEFLFSVFRSKCFGN